MVPRETSSGMYELRNTDKFSCFILSKEIGNESRTHIDDINKWSNKLVYNIFTKHSGTER